MSDDLFCIGVVGLSVCIPSESKFKAERSSEEIMRISQYLMKILTKACVGLTVYRAFTPLT